MSSSQREHECLTPIQLLFFFFLFKFLSLFSCDQFLMMSQRLSLKGCLGFRGVPPVTVGMRSTSSAIRCRMFADRPLNIGSLSGIISFSVARLRDALHYGQNLSAVSCSPVSTGGRGAFYSENESADPCNFRTWTGLGTAV